MMDKSLVSNRTRHVPLVIAAGVAATLVAAPAGAGGLLAYEVGTADVGLASAGYGARAQDASTVFTNPAGMTRLEGTQFLAAGQLFWNNTKFSIDSGTAPLLGNDDGGYAVGSGGWFGGGGGFLSYSVSPDLKLGFAMTGNFGAPLIYDDDWVGRYYVQEGTLLGLSFVPAIAYRVSESLSVGAQQPLSKTDFWGVAAEYLYGGSLDTDLQSTPVASGGRGDLDGSYDNLGTIFVAAYYNWQF
jgi:long-chain fatty acid transport protein